MESQEQIVSFQVLPSDGLEGDVIPPGDKSISHRAVLFNAIADGKAVIRGILRSEDVLSTINILISLGVVFEWQGDDLIVQGVEQFREPENSLYCGNSGTTMRLMLGLLSTFPIRTVFEGDSSLSNRPMKRITAYLKQFGVTCEGREQANYAPIVVQGRRDIAHFDVTIPMQSAQVKSALGLIALRCNGGIIRGGGSSRDHSERMLRAMGATCIDLGRGDIEIAPGRVRSIDIDVPGDFSSASFLIVAALIIPNSSLTIRNVGINPTRTGLLDCLLEMGGDITTFNHRSIGQEPVADITVRSSTLTGLSIDKERVVRMIDEVPIFAIAASQASGITRVVGAEELRKKESDRLEGIRRLLIAFGGTVRLFSDGFELRGNQKFIGAVVDSGGDHRIAMAGVVASAIANSQTIIHNIDCINTSFPNFQQIFNTVGFNIKKQ